MIKISSIARPVLLSLATVLAAGAQSAEVHSVVADKSAVSFVFREMNVPVDGRFRKFAAQVSFDPARPELAKAAIDVDLASIDTGSDEADGEAVGKAWFDTKSYPQAHFVSTGFKALGGNRYEVTGQISIKGRMREISAPFAFTPQRNGAAFDGSFTFKRADFALGEGSWADFGTVANEIQVKFHFLCL
ncbi:MAG: YceI family protein [Steroidobacterales bacterium]